ncbi:hypothetical protein ACFO3A_14020 [Comamonas nitrativorans]|uniref:Uncharacterized protein n=1 Tax=Comamonas nitrativorans TaxID=108437 RepID=A0ABV9H2V4_9BURK
MPIYPRPGWIKLWKTAGASSQGRISIGFVGDSPGTLKKWARRSSGKTGTMRGCFAFSSLAWMQL